MKVVFRESFERDLKKIRGDAQPLARVRQVIERAEAAETIGQLPSTKRMQGWSSYYRIRVGDYRLGVKLEDGSLAFLRFLHRRDIYRRFP